MKTIIESMVGNKYNLELTEEQIAFANWLLDADILYNVTVIDNLIWEEIKNAH